MGGYSYTCAELSLELTSELSKTAHTVGTFVPLRR